MSVFILDLGLFVLYNTFDRWY